MLELRAQRTPGADVYGDRRVTRGPGTERRYKGRTASQRAEQAAAWVVDEWAVRPSIGYHELIGKIRERFECGRDLAEQAIKVAREILHDRASDPAIADKIAAAYWQLYEDAVMNKDRAQARKALDSLRAHLGVGAPERRHVTGSVALDLDKLSDDELAEAAGMARDIAARSLERLAKNGANGKRAAGSDSDGDGGN